MSIIMRATLHDHATNTYYGHWLTKNARKAAAKPRRVLEVQHLPPRLALRRHQRAFRSDLLIEPVEDRHRIDQRRAVGQDQRRNATQRIGRAHEVEVGEDRARVVPEVEAQQAEADRDATGMG